MNVFHPVDSHIGEVQPPSALLYDNCNSLLNSTSITLADSILD